MAKRKISKKQRRIYRRRRIIALVLALLFLLACAGIIWGIGAGIHALREGSTQGDKTTTSQEGSKAKDGKASRKESDGKKAAEKQRAANQTSGVKKCGPDDITLDLSAPDPTTGVGGSIDFTAAVQYKGTGSCLIDASDSGRVLVITSGEQNIWRSDSCPSKTRSLLMATGDKDVQTITWNADASQEQCQPDDNLPRVDAGSYSAQLVLKSNDKVKSQVVPVLVQ